MSICRASNLWGTVVVAGLLDVPQQLPNSEVTNIKDVLIPVDIAEVTN